MINDVLLVARQAEVIRTLRGKTLASAPILLQMSGERIFQDAVICVDKAYLEAILELPDPFELTQAALALYDSADFAPYLKRIAQSDAV
jgi:hypothetical protein